MTRLPSSTPLARMPLGLRVGLALWRWALPMSILALILAGVLCAGIIHLTWKP